MTGAEINDGHFIVVSRSVVPTPGHIVVALVDGDRALKRLRKMDGRLWLVPEADGYSGHPRGILAAVESAQRHKKCSAHPAGST